jgi:hypothetical protein
MKETTSNSNEERRLLHITSAVQISLSYCECHTNVVFANIASTSQLH